MRMYLNRYYSAVFSSMGHLESNFSSFGQFLHHVRDFFRFFSGIDIFGRHLQELIFSVTQHRTGGVVDLDEITRHAILGQSVKIDRIVGVVENLLEFFPLSSQDVLFLFPLGDILEDHTKFIFRFVGSVYIAVIQFARGIVV